LEYMVFNQNIQILIQLYINEAMWGEQTSCGNCGPQIIPATCPHLSENLFAVVCWGNYSRTTTINWYFFWDHYKSIKVWIWVWNIWPSPAQVKSTWGPLRSPPCLALKLLALTAKDRYWRSTFHLLEVGN